ncbi:MAG: Crp/Fnr family transcriptional regulator [Pseudomonadota bacterium]
MNISERLAANQWLTSLPEDARAACIAAVRVVKMPANSVIFAEGDAPTGYFGILAGEVRFCKFTAGGRQSTLARLGPPRWFGELSFLDGGPRIHDALAVTPITLAKISAPDMGGLMTAYPAIQQGLIAQLARHTRQLYDAVDDLLLMSPERWLAKRLLEAAGTAAKVDINQEELARLVGVSRQSINRILRLWEEAGHINRGYGRITICARAALTDIVEGDPP